MENLNFTQGWDGLHKSLYPTINETAAHITPVSVMHVPQINSLEPINMPQSKQDNGHLLTYALIAVAGCLVIYGIYSLYSVAQERRINSNLRINKSDTISNYPQENQVKGMNDEV